MWQYLNQEVPFQFWIVLVGILVSATCSLISTYVVLRKMSLIAEGVSHAGFGGLALAVFLGAYFPILDQAPGQPGIGLYLQQAIAGLFCILTALLIGYFSRAKKVSEDSAIGIFLVASIAIGALLLAVRKNMSGRGSVPPDAEQLLFGNFTSVSPADGLNALILAAVCFSLVYLFYYELLYTTLDEQMARVNGVPTRFINVMLYSMVSLVVVVGIRMVGGLMITALTILPAATANMISRRFGGVLAASLIIGTGCSALSMYLSLKENSPLARYPAGPILVLTLFTAFIAVWIFHRFWKPTVTDAATPSA